MVAVGIVVAVAVLALGVFLFIHFQNKDYDEISFKETLDLVNVPVITFMHMGANNTPKKLNFVIDTGAVMSMLNAEIADECELHDYNMKGENYGLDGKPNSNDLKGIQLVYRDKQFKEVVMVNDFPIFRKIKEATGVPIHGMLGSAFLEKYKYVIDFDKYVMYSKGRRNKK